MIIYTTYINYSMQKRKKTCSIAILSRSNHQVHIIVLNEHVAYTIIVNYWILRLRITLTSKDFDKIHQVEIHIILFSQFLI